MRLGAILITVSSALAWQPCRGGGRGRGTTFCGNFGRNASTLSPVLLRVVGEGGVCLRRHCATGRGAEEKRGCSPSPHDPPPPPLWGRGGGVCGDGTCLPRRKRGGGGGFKKTADTPELLAHNVLLESELTGISDV